MLLQNVLLHKAPVDLHICEQKRFITLTNIILLKEEIELQFDWKSVRGRYEQIQKCFNVTKYRTALCWK